MKVPHIYHDPCPDISTPEQEARLTPEELEHRKRMWEIGEAARKRAREENSRQWEEFYAYMRCQHPGWDQISPSNRGLLIDEERMRQQREADSEMRRKAQAEKEQRDKAEWQNMSRGTKAAVYGFVGMIALPVVIWNILATIAGWILAPVVLLGLAAGLIALLVGMPYFGIVISLLLAWIGWQLSRLRKSRGNDDDYRTGWEKFRDRLKLLARITGHAALIIALLCGGIAAIAYFTGRR